MDTAGFDSAMAEQKRLARAAWAGSGEAAEEAVWFDLAEEIGATEFLGYDTERAEGVIRAIVRDGAPGRLGTAGEEVAIVLNQTPFYAEAGGQVGDTGEIAHRHGPRPRADVKKRAGGLSVHFAEVVEGEIVQGEAAELTVDSAAARRSAPTIRRRICCTRRCAAHLGEHVAQKGSLVAPDRLRFDFAHQKPVSAEEAAAIEAEVNAYIRQNDAVTTRIMTPDEAEALGARALFGEKYGDEVRVVAMGRRPEGESGPAGRVYSLELCGGTHVGRTGEIGLLRIVDEGASAAGIRRVEALTGAAALDHVATRERALAEAAAALRTRPEDLPARVRQLAEERRRLEAEVSELRRQAALGGGGTAEPQAREIGGIAFLGQVLQGIEPKDLRGLVDAHKRRLGSGAVLLIAETDGKAAVAAGVTEDLTARISAVELVRAAVPVLGGSGGGGRPDMAQGGGPDATRAAEAIAAAEARLAETAPA